MKEENQKLYEEFLEYLALKDYNLQGVRSRVKKIIAYLEENNLSPGELGVKEAFDFQGSLIDSLTPKGTPYSPKSILASMFVASNFYEFLKKKRIVFSNPFKEIKKLRIDKKVPRHLLKEKESERLLEELEAFNSESNLKKRITAYKVHVVCELLYSTGLRINEAANLSVSDIDFIRGMVKVRVGKGGSSRYAYLNDYAKEILRLYVEEMRPVIFNEWNRRRGDSLFGLCTSGLIHAVNDRLKEVTNRLDFPKMTCHGFRHLLGYHLLRAGCNIRYIQQILGHKTLKSTEIYTQVDKDSLKEVIDQYHPRKWRRIDDEHVDGHNS